MNWDRPFEDPVFLKNGRELKTLRAAAVYIQRLPRAEQEHPKAQTAIMCLIQAAEGIGPLMHARIAMLQFIHKDDPPRRTSKAVRERAWLPARRRTRD